MATLQQLNPIKIEVTVPEKYLNEFKVGQSFEFFTETNNKKSIAKVATIDPQIDRNTRSIVIRGIAENKTGLKPGNFVKINIDVSKNIETILIPTSAVVPILKGQKVYVMKNGKAVEKQIEISGRNEKSISVEKGLVEGDSLIAVSYTHLRAHETVLDLVCRLLLEKKKNHT